MKENITLEKVVPDIDGVPAKICKSTPKINCEENTLICSMHLHEEIELLYVYSDNSSAELSIELLNGERYIAHSGDVVCINSNVAHSTYTGKSGFLSYGMIQFKPELFSDGTRFGLCFENLGEDIKIFSDGNILKACDFLFRHENDTPTCRKFYLTSGIYAIMAALYENGFFKEERKLDSEKVSKLKPALDFISEKYSESISLSDAAVSSSLSSCYLCRLFKSAMGIGFTEYLTLVRIQHAVEALAQSSKSILEIALENGFSSLSYFNRVFKANKGCTPSEYRKLIKAAGKNTN